MLPFSVAIVQMNSTPDKAANMTVASQLISDALQQGARLVVLPEVFNCRGSHAPGFQTETIPGPSTESLMQLARQYTGWIIGGISEKVPGDSRAYNTCVVINPKGEIATRYRKIHLFDTALTVPPIRESALFLSGNTPVIAEIEGIKVGLSICYDLRFPELFQFYMKKGVHAVVVPSSFTIPSGELHWEILLRARAIETQCYVLAPNQTGVGTCGIPTFGNSMIVDPLGRILCRASADEITLLKADLDFDILHHIRSKMPLLDHKRQGLFGV